MTGRRRREICSSVNGDGVVGIRRRERRLERRKNVRENGRKTREENIYKNKADKRIYTRTDGNPIPRALVLALGNNNHIIRMRAETRGEGLGSRPEK